MADYHDLRVDCHFFNIEYQILKIFRSLNEAAARFHAIDTDKLTLVDTKGRPSTLNKTNQFITLLRKMYNAIPKKSIYPDLEEKYSINLFSSQVIYFNTSMGKGVKSFQ